MFTITHASYWNGRLFHAHTAQYDALKLVHDVTLPMGKFFRLVLLASHRKPRNEDTPFGVQEDHFIGNGFGEGAMFCHTNWNHMHVTLIVQDNMMFLALSLNKEHLLDLVEDYARDDHKLAEYIPLCYAA